jgi:hypothetical protein
VTLSPREDATRFDPVDCTAFRSELWALVAETHHFWPIAPFWHSPQGRICRDFAEDPTPGKYLVSALVDPLADSSPSCSAFRLEAPGHRWMHITSRLSMTVGK